MARWIPLRGTGYARPAGPQPTAPAGSFHRLSTPSAFGWKTLRVFHNWTNHLYGDMATATSATATALTSVQYDDVQVTSIGRNTVLTESFESGLNIGTDPNSLTTWYSCGQLNQLVSTGTLPDTWKRDVIYLGGEAIAEIDANGVHELHNDHLGSPRVITNRATGAVEGRQVFGPYGEILPSVTSGYQPLTGYTGHIQQDPSGLIYMRGRFFSPAWHRFINSDQGVDPMSWNQMAYVGGSPMQFTDPTGMKMHLVTTCTENMVWELIGSIAGAESFGWVIKTTCTSVWKDDGKGDPKNPAPVPDKVPCNEGQSIMSGDWIDKTGDALTGLADGLSLGIGPWLRGMADDAYPSLFGGIDNGVDESSTSYRVGSGASVVFGVGRMTYAGSAKAVSIFASSGARASVIRTGLKKGFSLGLTLNYRVPNLVGKTDAMLRTSAGKTNLSVNLFGAGMAASGTNQLRDCRK